MAEAQNVSRGPYPKGLFLLVAVATATCVLVGLFGIGYVLASALSWNPIFGGLSAQVIGAISISMFLNSREPNSGV